MPCLFCVFFERKKSHTKHTHSWKLIWPKRFKVCFDWRRHHQVFPTFFGHGILKGNELASIIMHKRPWKTSSFPMKLRQSLWKWMLNIFSCSLKLCKSAASCMIFHWSLIWKHQENTLFYSHTTATWRLWSNWKPHTNHPKDPIFFGRGSFVTFDPANLEAIGNKHAVSDSVIQRSPIIIVADVEIFL